MFRRKPKIKNPLVYQIEGRERGVLEAYKSQVTLLEAQYMGLLDTIMKRESIQRSEHVVFDSKQMAFIAVTPPSAASAKN